MRLLYVSRWWSHHDIRFAKAWQKHGVEFVALAADGTAPGDAAYSGPSLEARLRRAISEFQPDVVHAGPMTDIAPLVSLLWSGPLIAMSWGFDLMHEIDRDPVARERAIYALRRADRIIVDNNGPRAKAVALGASEEAIVQFAWGVDLSFYTPGESNFRVEHSIPHDAVVILSTRKHEAIYCVADVVDGFIRAASCSGKSYLVLAGNGSLTGSLKSRLADEGLQSRSVFVGELAADELRDAHRASDLYVSASAVDGTSISLLEAMACGTLVCVSRISGNHEWVDADTGLSFDLHDVDALAKIISDVSQVKSAMRSARYANITSAALRRVEQRADWARATKSLIGVAKSAIDHAHPVARTIAVES